MYPAIHWLLPAFFALTIALWPVAKERARLRTSLIFLALAGALWLTSHLPTDWIPALRILREIALSLIELSAVQIAAVILFDLILGRIRVPKFASEILIAAAYVAVLFELLFRLGVNVTGIFATSAVAAAVVGLALQDMLSNIAGGIVLELENDIRPGDFIRTADTAGWVRHVRLRHTSLATPEGDTLILPNNQLTRSAVRVVSAAQRHAIPFSMPYDINPQQVVDAVEFALRASPIPGIAPEPAPQCILQEMAAGHVRYAAVVWLARPGYDLKEISAVLMRVYFALQRAGIPATGISQSVDLRNPSEATHRTLGPVEVLRRTPVLRLLHEPELHAIASHMRRVSFAPGEHIIREGEEGDSMYFVASGQVAISFQDSRVSLMEPGDFFGEASLLTGEKRSVSAVAMSGADCYRLDKAGLQPTMSRVPELAEDMSVVMAHRQTELDSVRDKIGGETEDQTWFLDRIRRFFAM